MYKQPGKKIVYISSTLDLKEYRQAIETTFRQHSDVFEIGRIAEYMLPSCKPVLEECLSDVKKSDIYILLIGYRYGSLEFESQLSYTEQEYHCAKDANKEILVFFAADDIDLKKETVNPEKYQAFKNMVGMAHTGNVEPFTDPDSLVILLLNVLFARVKNILRPINNETIHLKCDRRRHVKDYKAEYLECRGDGVFSFRSIFYGTSHDEPENFSLRLAVMEFDLPLKIKLRKLDFGRSTVPDKCLRAMLREIYLQLSDLKARDDYDMDIELITKTSTIQGLFNVLREKGHKKLFIEFLVEDTQLNDPVIIETLRKFIDAIGSDLLGGGIVHLIFTIKGSEPLQNRAAEYELFRESFGEIFDLGELELIKREHIHAWLVEESNVTVYQQADDYITKYFGKGDFSIPIDQAVKNLQQLANELYSINNQQ